MDSNVNEDTSCFVYVLVSRARGALRFYTGISADVQKRLTEHNAGYTFSTKGYRPWELFFSEKYATRMEARHREKFLKSGFGREFVKTKWEKSSVACPPVGGDRASAF